MAYSLGNARAPVGHLHGIEVREDDRSDNRLDSQKDVVFSPILWKCGVGMSNIQATERCVDRAAI